MTINEILDASRQLAQVSISAATGGQDLIIYNEYTKRGLRLAVLPQEYNVIAPQNNRRLELLELGEYNHKGRRKLKELRFTAMLPGIQSAFFSRYPVPPAIAIRMLTTMKEQQQPIRVLVTGSTINGKFFIDDFSYGKQDHTSDWVFEISFSEYVERKKPVNSDDLTRDNTVFLSESKGKTVGVKKGDTLYTLAKKYYGDGNKWTELAKKNGITNPKKLQVGAVLKL